ncbi:MAG: NADH-quinone oxidoreductase subunit B, partial [Tomitella sp.]|nr:NADH-quinone oxidoreductase subunit B [Tomitella sp.]
NAIITLHEQIAHMPLGANREEAVRAAEKAALASPTTFEMKGMLR